MLHPTITEQPYPSQNATLRMPVYEHKRSLSRSGQCNVPGGAREQQHPEAEFHLMHQPADCRLRNAHVGGGGNETAIARPPR